MTPDVLVVGSGPAGSAAARVLARGGARVRVIEAGPRHRGPPPPTLGEALATSYEAMGARTVLGTAPIPYVQGRGVGGSSPINGAICWRLPADVHARWLASDPALESTLPWATLEVATDTLERRLGVAETSPAVRGRQDERMARGAEALGLDHRPTRRNAPGCVGSGACLRGCPVGGKASVDRTLLVDAEAAGAEVIADCEASRILCRRGRVAGVIVRRAGGVETWPCQAVFVAASAVHSAALLLRSGLGGGAVGRYFQCHPGASVAGRFADEIGSWRGATQGHEVVGLREEGLKFESLALSRAMLASRLHGLGRSLAAELDTIDRWAEWAVAVRAEAVGRVHAPFGRPWVCWSAAEADRVRLQRGLAVLAAMMFAAGAERVVLGLDGGTSIPDAGALEAFARAPTPPARAFQAVITHMFGTCRMGSDPTRSVVRPDGRLHGVEGLYVVDSSVFPTSTGVNPQISIMAVASVLAARWVGAEDPA